MNLSRRWLALGALGAAGAGVWAFANRPKPRPRAALTRGGGRPLNVLLIVSDQERAWSLYPQGFIETHTPARAWLLENGVSFTRAHTPTPICSTARGVIYSGAHSPNNAVWDNVPLPYASDMRRDIPTLGSMFLDAGYVTGYSGKWHLSKLDTRAKAPDPDGVRAEIRDYGFADTDVTEETDGPAFGHLYDRRTVDRALAFIARHRGGDAPWFQAVNLLNPHDVMYYTSGDAMTQSRKSQFPDRSERPPDDPLYQQDLGYPLAPNYGPASFGVRPAAAREYGLTYSAAMGELDYGDERVGREFQNFYWNCTRDCDRHLKALIDGLAALGELERTIIVFTSDHGELLGVHGLRGKGVVPYREAVSIPLTIVHPDGQKGAVSAALVSQIDLAPTLLAFAGVSQASVRQHLPGLTGREVSGLVATPSAPGPRSDDGLLFHWTSFAFMDHTTIARFNRARAMPPTQRVIELASMLRESTSARGLMRGAMNDRYKFARYFSARQRGTPRDWTDLVAGYDIELYDLAADPGETTNLAADPDRHREAILAMNTLTNTLIAREIGDDDGRFMPVFARI